MLVFFLNLTVEYVFLCLRTAQHFTPPNLKSAYELLSDFLQSYCIGYLLLRNINQWLTSIKHTACIQQIFFQKARKALCIVPVYLVLILFSGNVIQVFMYKYISIIYNWTCLKLSKYNLYVPFCSQCWLASTQIHERSTLSIQILWSLSLKFFFTLPEINS